MSTRAVEELIMKAVGDSDFRQRLESTPEEIFSEFDLTAEEREAVNRVQKRLSLEETEPEKVGALMDIVPLAPWF